MQDSPTSRSVKSVLLADKKSKAFCFPRYEEAPQASMTLTTVKMIVNRKQNSTQTNWLVHHPIHGKFFGLCSADWLITK